MEDKEDKKEGEDQEEFLITHVNKIIEESKLGSTMLVSTE